MAALVALAALPATASAAPVLPDLVADPPAAPVIEEDTEDGALRLRFDGHVHNRGPGRLQLEGTGPVDGAMSSVVQRVFGADVTEQQTLTQPAAAFLFETNDTHRHWHLREIARYSLWNLEQTAEVAPSMKAGFCLMDSDNIERISPSLHQDPSNCAWGERDKPEVVMGVSPGWRDRYHAGLAFQWVDISAVRPGQYRLRSDIDLQNVVTEENEVNPPGWTPAPAVVPGHSARDFTTAGLSRASASTIKLQADTYTTGDWTPGAVEFRVVEAPEHGDLDVQVGEWIDGDEVVYTPDADAPADDVFTFEARDATTTSFPTAPFAAVATLDLDAAPDVETVAISGAPAELLAGTSVQLSAVVTGGSSTRVDWTVPGGAAHGTVSPTGLYQAPAAVPPGEVVTVRAETSSGTSDEVRLRVRPVPVAEPAPSPVPPATVAGGPGVPSTAPAPRPAGPRRAQPVPRQLGLRAIRDRRGVVAAIVPGVAGRLRVSLMSGSRRVSTCVSQVRAGRSYRCRLAIKGRAAGRLRVAASLRRLNGRVITRSVAVSAASQKRASASAHRH